MEHLVFSLIEELRREILTEVLHPAEEKQSSFSYGRVHGILFACATLEEKLRNEIEAQAQRQEVRERQF